MLAEEVQENLTKFQCGIAILDQFQIDQLVSIWMSSMYSINVSLILSKQLSIKKH